MAAATIIAAARPDVLLLTEFDYDHDGVALAAFAALLAEAGHPMPHSFAAEPNSGRESGLDQDGDGQHREPEDAQGYGWFSGDGGMAVLSTLPILTDQVQDHSALLWQHLPGAQLPEVEGQLFHSAMTLSLLRLSSKAHWAVPVQLPDGEVLTLLTFSATAPVFDGPEDRNGLRNADEIRFWQLWLDGAFGPVPEGPVAVLANANLDPVDADGRREVIAALLEDPRLQDPQPRSLGGALTNDPDHLGDPGLDTVNWPPGAPGNLRVSYVLPDARLEVAGAGVVWPGPGQDLSDLVRGENGGPAGPHRLVWADILR